MFRNLPPIRRPRAAGARRTASRFRPNADALEGRALLSQVYHAVDGPSLAAAVQQADQQSGPSQIVLDRTGNYDLPSTSSITADMTITGARNDRPDLYVIQLKSGEKDRVLDVKGAHRVELDGVTIQGGSTSGDGGGIEVETTGARLTLDDVVVQNNTAGSDGGGVYMADGAGLSIAKSVVSHNTAGGDGGGVYFNASSQDATVDVRSTRFDRNQAQGKGTSSMGDGGGIIVQATTPPGASSDARPPAVGLDVRGSSFTRNASAHDGGGLWANDVTRVSAEGLYVSNNSSVQDAGGFGDSVMHLNGASFQFTDSYVAGNQCTGPGSQVPPDAGGVCFDFQAGSGTPAPTGHVTATLSGNVLANNSVSGSGGGAFVRDEASQTSFDATVSRNAFAGNQATLGNIASEDNGAGGGLSIAGSAGSNTLTLDRNVFARNTAASDGGGLYLRLDSGTADVSQSAFGGNHADDAGGGVYLTGGSGAVVNLARVIIAHNSAGKAGGGVFNDGVTARIKGSRIVDNTAPTDPDVSGPYEDQGVNTIG